MKPIHYAGKIQTARGQYLAGWAACCSGDRAVKIRETGRNTYDRTQVTCKRCLQAIDANDEYARKTGKASVVPFLGLSFSNGISNGK